MHVYINQEIKRVHCDLLQTAEGYSEKQHDWWCDTAFTQQLNIQEVYIEEFIFIDAILPVIENRSKQSSRIFACLSWRNSLLWLFFPE